MFDWYNTNKRIHSAYYLFIRLVTIYLCYYSLLVGFVTKLTTQEPTLIMKRRHTAYVCSQLDFAHRKCAKSIHKRHAMGKCTVVANNDIGRGIFHFRWTVSIKPWLLFSSFNLCFLRTFLFLIIVDLNKKLLCRIYSERTCSGDVFCCC